MNPVEVREMLERVGALLTGHFKLSSGRHSDQYVQKQRVFEHPRLTASLGQAIAKAYADRDYSVVVAPAVGALTLGHSVAHAANVRFLFTERVDDAMAFRRGQALERGEHVLVVEDVITTGGSAAEVLEAVEAAGARAVGVACLVDRSQSTPAFPVRSLVRMEARDWEPSDCPRCVAGDPIDSPGSRFITKPG